MGDIVPSLKLGLLPRLGQEPAIDEGFRSWVLSGAYQPTAWNSNTVIALEVADAGKLVRHISFDFERFALASMESFSVAYAEWKDYHLAGWPLLKLYYAAFFSAHSIMRSQGSGVVKLERPHTDYLNNIVSLLQLDAPSVCPGMYQYKTESSPTTGRLVVLLEPTPQDCGVHEGFWKLFCKFLMDGATKAVHIRAANANEYLAGADEICGAIRHGSSNSGIWFSMVRNEINYQHKYETWFPVRKRALAIGALKSAQANRLSVLPTRDTKTKDPIGAFVNTSKYLACLNTDLADFVAQRSNSGQSFGHKWKRIVAQL